MRYVMRKASVSGMSALDVNEVRIRVAERRQIRLVTQRRGDE
jgi:hypothetical protein